MFWDGFFKIAARMQIGTKALRSGRLTGNKPTPMVSTVGYTKPNQLPTPKPHASNNISKPKLPDSGTMKQAPKPKNKGAGVGETKL
jgi:hypothetical protein